MDYDGCRYMGMLIFDDQIFCAEMFALLKANIGRSIKEIGDLDLSHTFNSRTTHYLSLHSELGQLILP